MGWSVEQLTVETLELKSRKNHIIVILTLYSDNLLTLRQGNYLVERSEESKV